MLARSSTSEEEARPRAGEAVEGVEASKSAAKGAMVDNMVIDVGWRLVVVEWCYARGDPIRTNKIMKVVGEL